MTDPHRHAAAVPTHDVAIEETERQRWDEIIRLVRSLSLEERLEPGYQRDPDWSVRDVMGHIGTWLAEAEVQLEQIGAGTYEGHEVDVDALNATFLEALADQPWEVAWLQANAGRTRMLDVWAACRDTSDEADWWVRKSGVEHYLEHLDRLREWVDELRRRRGEADGREAGRRHDRRLSRHATATSPIRRRGAAVAPAAAASHASDAQGGSAMTFAGEVQVGWTVWSSDGENLGTIVSIDPQTISVKQGGLLGGKLDIPRTAVEDVETGRVELSMTKQELKSVS